MDGLHSIIELRDLLDEVSRDLDEFRKKHATDFGVKNVTLWWELQKERLLLRHAPTTLLSRAARFWKWRRALGWFLAGSAVHLAAQTAVLLIVG